MASAAAWHAAVRLPDPDGERTAPGSPIEPAEEVERVARAIQPDVFSLPRIKLYREEYDRAFRLARAAIAAIKGASKS
jgi:hypothetical protein